MKNPSSETSEQLRQKIVRLLAAKGAQPRDAAQILKALRLGAGWRERLGAELRDLERAGVVARVRGGCYVLPETADLVTGIIQIRPSGSGHILAVAGGGEDIYVAAEDTGTALNGDRVVARLLREPAPPTGSTRRVAPAQARRSARVIRIVERANEFIVGTLQKTRQFHFVIPDDPRMPHDVYVHPETGDGRRARVGDKVVVRLDEWTSRHVNPEGRIVEVLGATGEPGVDMLAIIRQYDLPREFPAAALREADAAPGHIPSAEVARREDLRGEFIFTIDPDDARDFDDAVQVRRTPHGWRLGVHIADVSYYVAPGSALDREARRRGNSVYLPDRVLPMLPERLSNDLCSLRPGEDRLVFSAFLDFDAAGKPRRARFARSIIRSAARLTYREALSILEGRSRSDSPLATELRAAWELAALLRRNRFAAGALDLDMPEVKVRLDAQSHPVGLEKIENDISHQLIEEFMLATNEAVARALKNHPLPALYRVHEPPAPEKLAEFREFAAIHGYRAGDLTQRAELSRLLTRFRGRPDEHAMKVALLRSLKRARYAAQPIGHYGLAKVNYTHFTSPIRRYADLVVHRVLGRLTTPNGAPTRVPPLPAPGELEKIAEHVSQTERIADNAEQDAVRLKKLEYFQRQIDRRRPDTFAAVVLDVRNFGLFVELPDVQVSGMIHVSALTDDFYTFDAARLRLVGRRRRRVYKVGDRIEVIVARIDTAKQQIDFAPV